MAHLADPAPLDVGAETAYDIQRLRRDQARAIAGLEQRELKVLAREQAATAREQAVTAREAALDTLAPILDNLTGLKAALASALEAAK